MHVKSLSDAGEVATVTIPDCTPPTTEAIAAAGVVLLEEVFKAMAALDPNVPLVPLRSGAMAPMNT